MTPHIPVLIAIIFLLLYGTIQKVKFSLLQDSMIQSVSTSMGAIFLFFFIWNSSICTYDVWSNSNTYVFGT